MKNTELACYLQAQSEAHMLCDTDYRIVSVNSAFKKLCHSTDDVIGKTCYAVSHGYDAPCNLSGETCPLVQSKRSGKPERVVHLHHTPNGEEYVSIEITPVKNQIGAISGFVEKIEPIKVANGEAPFYQLCGHTNAFKQMMHLVKSCASSDINVLISGESGTGKERVAQAIHHASRRAAKPFIAVDCASLSDALFDTELFGQASSNSRNATQHKGLVDAADGGTLYLDEICDIPLSVQSKLLHFIETRAFKRVGSNTPHHADVRIIASTTQSIVDMIQAGRYRAALYYRINTFPIRIPPLRERKEDIAEIASSLLARYPTHNKLHLSEQALASLMDYDFPGNIRELGNFLERATLLCENDTIEAKHLLVPTKEKNNNRTDATAVLAMANNFTGSRQELAKLLGISERTLYRRLNKQQAKNAS